MFNGDAGSFFFFCSPCVSFSLSAQCHVASRERMATHVYVQMSVSAALAQQANTAANQKGEDMLDIYFQSLAKFWDEEDTPGKI